MENSISKMILMGLLLPVFSRGAAGFQRIFQTNSDKSLVLLYDCSSSALNTPFLKIISKGDKKILFLAGENEVGHRIVTPLFLAAPQGVNQNSSKSGDPVRYQNGAIVLTISDEHKQIELDDGMGNVYNCSETPFYRFQWRGFSMIKGASFFQMNSGF